MAAKSAILLGASQFCSQARNWSFEARGCGAGGRRKEAEGKRQKEGAKRSIFTNMRCSRSSSRASLTAQEAIRWVNWDIDPEEFSLQT
ncbi:hypothetical protein QUB05_17185 [Microcoleus sp. F10-C6]|uniref:hypothetical protein n=1 Tax=unclassified Microcoleus TaxID=2642155 RepID=UPI002FD76359